jgi:hypothetical protein
LARALFEKGENADLILLEGFPSWDAQQKKEDSLAGGLYVEG